MELIALLAAPAIILPALLAFHYGKLCNEAKKSKETAQIAFGAALWAVTEAKGLKNATVIRSIVEKYNFLEKKSEESTSREAKEMEQQLEAAISEAETETKKKRENPFQETFNPEDLV